MKVSRWSHKLIIVLVIISLIAIAFNRIITVNTKNSSLEIIASSISKKDVPNTTIYRYRINKNINSKSDFIEFLKYRAKAEIKGLYIERFRDVINSVGNGNLEDLIKVEKKSFKTHYIIQYKVPLSNTCTIDASSDGHIIDTISAGV